MLSQVLLFLVLIRFNCSVGSSGLSGLDKVLFESVGLQQGEFSCLSFM